MPSKMSKDTSVINFNLREFFQAVFSLISSYIPGMVSTNRNNNSTNGSELKPKSDYRYDKFPFFARQLSTSITFMSASEDVEIVLSSIEDLGKYPTEGRSVCIIFCWLNAELKGVKNYAKFYTDNGFDVVAVRFNVLDVLLPRRLEEVIKHELIPLLLLVKYEKTVVHGFSVGGYVWSRLIKNMELDLTGKVAEFFKTIRCTIWDSVVDLNYCKKGIGFTIFPNSKVLRHVLVILVDLYMKVFYNSCTKYLEEGNYYAYCKPMPVPSLLIYSDTDFISPEELNIRLRRSWESFGVPCRSKSFIGTKHVLHMKAYPLEYLSELKKFLVENEMT